MASEHAAGPSDGGVTRAQIGSLRQKARLCPRLGFRPGREAVAQRGARGRKSTSYQRASRFRLCATSDRRRGNRDRRSAHPTPIWPTAGEGRGSGERIGFVIAQRQRSRQIDREGGEIESAAAVGRMPLAAPQDQQIEQAGAERMPTKRAPAALPAGRDQRRARLQRVDIFAITSESNKERPSSRRARGSCSADVSITDCSDWRRNLDRDALDPSRKTGYSERRSSPCARTASARTRV